jgi:hypothetical protein
MVHFDRASSTCFEILVNITQELKTLAIVNLKVREDLQDLLAIYVRWGNSPPARIAQGLNLLCKIQIYSSNVFDTDKKIYFWKRTVGIIGKLCQEHRRDLRVRAYSVMQGILLGEEDLDN